MYNAFIGNNAGYATTTGTDNIFIGYYAGSANTTSSNNCAVGFYALSANTTRTGYNSAFGVQSLAANTSGYDNSAVGGYALNSNTTGTLNTAVGYNAGNVNTTGSNNTYLGYSANSSAIALSNATAVGSNAIVLGSNRIQLGATTATNGVYAYGPYNNISDGRFKVNIKEEVKGLQFINKLRPVVYNLDVKKLDDYIIQNMPDSIKAMHQKGMDFSTSLSVIHSGFIAQEVEKAAKESGFANTIVDVPTDKDGLYSLAYSELVVPLVKAVQELSGKVDSVTTTSSKQDSIITQQNSKISDLQTQLNYCCTSKQQGMKKVDDNNIQRGNNNKQPGLNNQDFQSTQSSGGTIEMIPALLQNNPNPFNQQTTIQYYLPTETKTASLMVFDMQGKLIKTISVSNYGNASVTINANELSPGMFIYSLIADGKEIDNKRMILTE